MPNDTVRVLRCLVKGDTIPMKVSPSVGEDVDDLKAMVHERGKNSILRDTDIQDLFVWKLKNQESLLPEESLGDRVFSQGPLSTIAVKLESSARIGDIFKDQPKLGLHIVVQLVPSPSLKHPRSPSAEGSGEAKKKRTTSHPFPRKWTVNGAITEHEMNGRYYVDPGTQDVTLQCLQAVSEGTYMLLAGARASGKSTRLI